VHVQERKPWGSWDKKRYRKGRRYNSKARYDKYNNSKRKPFYTSYLLSVGLAFEPSASGGGRLGPAFCSFCAAGVLAEGGGARGALELAADVAIRWSSAFRAIALGEL
jgi:hypothetical protein